MTAKVSCARKRGSRRSRFLRMRGVEFGIAEVRGKRASVFRAPVSGFVTPFSQGDDRRLIMGNAAKRYLLSKLRSPLAGRMVSGEADTIHLAAKIWVTVK